MHRRKTIYVGASVAAMTVLAALAYYHFHAAAPAGAPYVAAHGSGAGD